MDPGRLAMTVTHGDGRRTRWSFDDVDTATRLGDLSFSSAAPGGFKDLSCSLLRGIEPRDDEGLFDQVTVYGPGGQTVWEGRIAQLPRQTGSTATLTPGAVGFSAHLEDNQSFREVYVDRDASAWGDMPIERQASLLGSGINTGDISYTGSGDTLIAAISDQALGAQTASNAWYQAPAGVRIAEVAFVGSLFNMPAGWTQTFYGTDDIDATTSATGTGGTFNGTSQTTTWATPRRYVFHQVYSNGNALTPASGAHVKIERLAVYGDHGLTLYTTTPGYPLGVRASDVITDVLGRVCPLLNITSGSVQTTTFAIPQLTFKDPTTAADVISRTNAFQGWDWMVWENRTFYYQPAGTGTQWQARRADGAQLSLEGDTADQLINGVIVTFSDGTRNLTAGPPGSGCDYTDPALQDTSAGNPVNTHATLYGGTFNRWPPLALSTPTTPVGAIEQGALYLAERNLAARRGQLTVTGTIRHPTEGMVPVSRVRGGDTVRLTDRPGDPVRRIVEATYTHATRTATLTLDSTAHKLDALMERLAVYTGALAP